jgi:cytochrome o ubiquinol oxidase subunit 2
MTEHVNRLNLMGDTLGDYEGSSAEINGNGFAYMRFTTRVSTPEDFDAWVTGVQQTAPALTTEAYDTLLKPSQDNPAALYSDPDDDLYASILRKYEGSHSGDHGYKKKDEPGHQGGSH